MITRIALMGMTAVAFAVFEPLPLLAANAQKCEAVYQQYPIQRCRNNGGSACFERNAENRQKRQAAGCKPSQDYQS